jgi:hypothetical protein
MLGILQFTYLLIEEFNVSIYYDWKSYNVDIEMLITKFHWLYLMSRIGYEVWIFSYNVQYIDHNLVDK